MQLNGDDERPSSSSTFLGFFWWNMTRKRHSNGRYGSKISTRKPGILDAKSQGVGIPHTPRPPEKKLFFTQYGLLRNSTTSEKNEEAAAGSIGRSFSPPPLFSRPFNKKHPISLAHKFLDASEAADGYSGRKHGRPSAEAAAAAAVVVQAWNRRRRL